MTKVIANSSVELSISEWEYYKEIESIFGDKAFLGMFDVNKAGEITMVKPPLNKPTSMVLIFFLLNVQFNQKLRKLTDGLISIRELNEKVDKLQKKVKELS
jgi:hypothetical protein